MNAFVPPLKLAETTAGGELVQGLSIPPGTPAVPPVCSALNLECGKGRAAAGVGALQEAASSLPFPRTSDSLEAPATMRAAPRCRLAADMLPCGTVTAGWACGAGSGESRSREYPNNLQL